MFGVLLLSRKAVFRPKIGQRTISTSDFIGTEHERFRFWTKAKPMILSLLVGSMALQVQWCKEAYHDYMREADTRVQLLKDHISAVQAQLDGKELDQSQVPRGILFGVPRTKLEMPEVSTSIPKTADASTPRSDSRFL